MTAASVPKSPPIRQDSFSWHPDCRYFVGGLPCRYWRACPGCPHYDPVQQRILIVMLGLLGDMLIASPLPARIKRDNPAAHVTWLVDEACAPILRMNPYIDRVLPFDWASATYLLSESFAAVYSFERTPSAASVVDRVTASHKAGLAYGGSHNGLYAMGEVAEHFFRMNTWNDFRVHLNKKTWTELYFAIAGYQYEQEAYVLRVPAAALARVSSLLAVTDRSRVCLNIGGSLKTKIWPVTHWLTIGAALLEENCEVVITGGVSDMDMCEAIHRGLGLFDPLGDRVHYSQLSIEEFAAVPSRCDVVVTGDSLGFHLALAHETPCVLLLGPSNGAEVVPKHATYVAALRSDLACSPCAHQVSCAGVGGCMDTIKPSKVLAETRRLLAERRDRRSSG